MFNYREATPQTEEFMELYTFIARSGEMLVAGYWMLDGAKRKSRFIEDADPRSCL